MQMYGCKPVIAEILHVLLEDSRGRIRFEVGMPGSYSVANSVVHQDWNVRAWLANQRTTNWMYQSDANRTVDPKVVHLSHVARHAPFRYGYQL